MSLKSKLSGNQLDLSLSQLTEIPPIKQLQSLKKATEYDLSCNKLTYLPEEFGSLTLLVRLDLSQNLLTALPDSIGKLVNLQYLDLYKNRLAAVPVSMCRLKALRWLDIKDNPLDPTLRSIAGDCLNEKECMAAAKNIVQFMQRIQSDAERQKQKRLLEEREKELLRKAAEEEERKIKAAEKRRQKEARKAERQMAARSQRANDASHVNDYCHDDDDAAYSGQKGNSGKGRNWDDRLRPKRSTSRGFCGGLLGWIRLFFLCFGCLGICAAAVFYNSCTSPYPSSYPSSIPHVVPREVCRQVYDRMARFHIPLALVEASYSAQAAFHGAQEYAVHAAGPYVPDWVKSTDYKELGRNAYTGSRKYTAIAIEKTRSLAALVAERGPEWYGQGLEYAKAGGTKGAEYAKVGGTYVIEKVSNFVSGIPDFVNNFWDNLPRYWENAKWFWRNLK